MSTLSAMALAAALVASPEPAEEFAWTPVAMPLRSAASDGFEWSPVAMPTRAEPTPAPRVVVPPVIYHAPPGVIVVPPPGGVCPPPVIIHGPYIPR